MSRSRVIFGNAALEGNLRGQLIQWHRLARSRRVTAWTILTCCSALAASATADSLDALAGPQFTDPNKVFSMPEAWLRRPIIHRTRTPVDLAVFLDLQQYAVLMPLIQEFGNKHNLRLAVGEGTCGTSAGALAEKHADIGGFCCPPGKVDRLPGLRFHTVGIGPVAIIVHPDNPIDEISLREARQIFSGKIRQWSELRRAPQGYDLDVQPVVRLHCKLRPGHWRYLLDKEEYFEPLAFDAAGIDDMLLHVSRSRAAIGFACLGQIDNRRDRIKVKTLRLAGYDPRDVDALAAGLYPFYQVFNLTTWQDAPAANPWAERLVEYILENVDRIDPGYVFVSPKRLRRADWKFRDGELIGEPR